MLAPVVHEDLTLVERCRAGVPGAFEELYRAHAPRLFGLACRLVGRTEAEDLLQEIFLAAHRKLGQYHGESALGTWLFRLATNLCIDHLRSRAGRWSTMVDPLDDQRAETSATLGRVLGTVDRIDLERAVGKLPAGARTVFVLHDVEGLRHDDIATLLDISEGTSKSQLHRARMALRHSLAAGRTAGGTA